MSSSSSSVTPSQERACLNLWALSQWGPFHDPVNKLVDRTPYALSILEYSRANPQQQMEIVACWKKGCIQDMDSSICVLKDSGHLLIVDSVRLEVREISLKDISEVKVRSMLMQGVDGGMEISEWQESCANSRLICKLNTMCFSMCVDEKNNEVLITHPRGITEEEQRERIIAVSLGTSLEQVVINTTSLNLGYCIPAIKYSSKSGYIYILDHENSSLLRTQRVGNELNLVSILSLYHSKIGGHVQRLSLPEDFDIFIDQEGRECIVVADTDNKRIVLWRGDDPIGIDLTGRMSGEPISVEVDTTRRFGSSRGPRVYFGMLPTNNMLELDLTSLNIVERMSEVIPLDIAIDKRNGRVFVADDITKSIIQVGFAVS